MLRRQVVFIETMQPTQGALPLASAFMRLERLALQVMLQSQDQDSYERYFQMLSQYGGAELKAMLFYYHQSEAYRLHAAKYVEAFRRLQYLVSQTMALLP